MVNIRTAIVVFKYYLKKYYSNLKYQKVLRILLIVGPLILIMLPSSYFDKGETMCLSIKIFDQPCFGCGITRSIMKVIHLKFEEAWRLNKIAFIITPIGILFWIRLIFKIFDKDIFNFLKTLF